jgi:HK97 gp10 family phage protein
MARPSRSRAKLDFTEVVAFEKKLALTASLADRMAEDWEQEHGEKWMLEMIHTVPVGPGDPVHLYQEIDHVEPGKITMGQAYWWRFLEYGTVHMGPQPFIKPAMKRIRTPARKDAAERARELLRGRL